MSDGIRTPGSEPAFFRQLPDSLILYLLGKQSTILRRAAARTLEIQNYSGDVPYGCPTMNGFEEVGNKSDIPEGAHEGAEGGRDRSAGR